MSNFLIYKQEALPGKKKNLSLSLKYLCFLAVSVMYKPQAGLLDPTSSSQLKNYYTGHTYT